MLFPILLLLVFFVLVVFVLFESSNSERSMLKDNKKIKQIKTERYLTNIYYKNEQNEFRHSFVQVVNENNDKQTITFKNIMLEHKKETVVNKNIISKLYDPKVYLSLYKLLSEYKDGERKFLFKKPVYVSIVVGEQENVFKMIGVEFKYNHIFVVCNDNVLINLVDIDSIKIEQSYTDNYISKKQVNSDITENSLEINDSEHLDTIEELNNKKEIYEYLRLKKYHVVENEINKDIDITLLFLFFNELSFYENYDNCSKASRFFFININKLNSDLKELAFHYLKEINLINVHIEFFLLLKLNFKQNKELLFDFFVSLFPHTTLSKDGFFFAWDLLDLSLLKNHIETSFYSSYLIDLLNVNIMLKYDEKTQELFAKVKNNIS